MRRRSAWRSSGPGGSARRTCSGRSSSDVADGFLNHSWRPPVARRRRVHEPGGETPLGRDPAGCRPLARAWVGLVLRVRCELLSGCRGSCSTAARCLHTTALPRVPSLGPSTAPPGSEWWNTAAPGREATRDTRCAAQVGAVRYDQQPHAVASTAAQRSKALAAILYAASSGRSSVSRAPAVTADPHDGRDAELPQRQRNAAAEPVRALLSVPEPTRGSVEEDVLQRLLLLHRRRTDARLVASPAPRRAFAREAPEHVGGIATTSDPASWEHSFAAFSDALARRSVFPTIQHVNLLLAVAVRHKRWKQQRAVEQFIFDIQRIIEGLQREWRERGDAAASSLPASCSSGSAPTQLDTGGTTTTMVELSDTAPPALGQHTAADVGEGMGATCNDERPLGRALNRAAQLLLPTEQTFQLLMVSAVERKQWHDAIEAFQQLQLNALPISDPSLYLLLSALRLADVRRRCGPPPPPPDEGNDFLVKPTSNPTSDFWGADDIGASDSDDRVHEPRLHARHWEQRQPTQPPLTNSRGGHLAQAARPRRQRQLRAPSVVSHAAPRVWQVALTVFLSYRHRVRSPATVHAMLELLAFAGQHSSVLELFEDCRRTLHLKPASVRLAMEAAARERQWKTALALICPRLEHSLTGGGAVTASSSHSTDAGATQQRLGEDFLLALQACRGARQSRVIVSLFYRFHQALYPSPWTRQALGIVAQAALELQLLPLLLQLVHATPVVTSDADMGNREAPSQCPEHIVDPDASLAATPAESHSISSRGILCDASHGGGHEPRPSASLFNPSAPPCAEIYDAALAGIHQSLASPMTGLREVPPRDTPLETVADVQHRETQNHQLDQMAWSLYQEYLHRASPGSLPEVEPATARQRGARGTVERGDAAQVSSDRAEGTAEFHLFPAVREQSPIHAALVHYVRLSGAADSDHSCWQRALQQLSQKAQPDGLAVSLAAQVLRNEKRWKEALQLLQTVLARDRGVRVGTCYARPAATSIVARHVIASAHTVPFVALHAIQVSVAAGIFSKTTAVSETEHVYRLLAESQEAKRNPKQSQPDGARCGEIVSGGGVAVRFLGIDGGDEASRAGDVADVVCSLAAVLKYATISLLGTEERSGGKGHSYTVQPRVAFPLPSPERPGNERNAQAVQLLREAIALLQQLQVEKGSLPSSAPFYQLTDKLQVFVGGADRPAWAGVTGRPGIDDDAFITLTVMAIVNALLHQVAVTDSCRWTLWKPCLQLLQIIDPRVDGVIDGGSFADSLYGVGDSGTVSVGLHTIATTYKTLAQFFRRCDKAEAGFVEGVIQLWIFRPGVLRDAPDATAVALTPTSANLVLEALVWAARRRERDMVLRLVTLSRPALSLLVHATAANEAAEASESGRLARNYVDVLCVVAQCLSSGPHESVMRDWDTLFGILGELAQICGSASTAEASNASSSNPVLQIRGRDGYQTVKQRGALQDALAAICHDKLRRTALYVARKCAIDRHRTEGLVGAHGTGSEVSDHDAEKILRVARELVGLCNALVECTLGLLAHRAAHGCAQGGDGAVQMNAMPEDHVKELHLLSVKRWLMTMWETSDALRKLRRIDLRRVKQSRRTTAPSTCGDHPPLPEDHSYVLTLLRCIHLHQLLVEVGRSIQPRSPPNSPEHLPLSSPPVQWLDVWLTAVADAHEERLHLRHSHPGTGSSADGGEYSASKLLHHVLVLDAVVVPARGSPSATCRHAAAAHPRPCGDEELRGSDEVEMGGGFLIQVVSAVSRLTKRTLTDLEVPHGVQSLSSASKLGTESGSSPTWTNSTVPNLFSASAILEEFNSPCAQPCSMRGLLLIQSVSIPLLTILSCEPDGLESSSGCSDGPGLRPMKVGRMQRQWDWLCVVALAGHCEGSSTRCARGPSDGSSYAAVARWYLGAWGAEAPPPGTYNPLRAIMTLIARHNRCIESEQALVPGGVITGLARLPLLSSAGRLLTVLLTGGAQLQGALWNLLDGPTTAATVMALRLEDVTTATLGHADSKRLGPASQSSATVLHFVLKGMFTFPMAVPDQVEDSRKPGPHPWASSVDHLQWMCGSPSPAQKQVLLQLTSLAATRRPRLFNAKMLRQWNALQVSAVTVAGGSASKPSTESVSGLSVREGGGAENDDDCDEVARTVCQTLFEGSAAPESLRERARRTAVPRQRPTADTPGAPVGDSAVPGGCLSGMLLNIMAKGARAGAALLENAEAGRQSTEAEATVVLECIAEARAALAEALETTASGSRFESAAASSERQTSSASPPRVVDSGGLRIMQWELLLAFVSSDAFSNRVGATIGGEALPEPTGAKCWTACHSDHLDDFLLSVALQLSQSSSLAAVVVCTLAIVVERCLLRHRMRSTAAGGRTEEPWSAERFVCLTLRQRLAPIFSDHREESAREIRTRLWICVLETGVRMRELAERQRVSALDVALVPPGNDSALGVSQRWLSLALGLCAAAATSESELSQTASGEGVAPAQPTRRPAERSRVERRMAGGRHQAMCSTHPALLGLTVHISRSIVALLRAAATAAPLSTSMPSRRALRRLLFHFAHLAYLTGAWRELYWISRIASTTQCLGDEEGGGGPYMANLEVKLAIMTVLCSLCTPTSIAPQCHSLGSVLPIGQLQGLIRVLRGKPTEHDAGVLSSEAALVHWGTFVAAVREGILHEAARGSDSEPVSWRQPRGSSPLSEGPVSYAQRLRRTQPAGVLCRTACRPPFLADPEDIRAYLFYFNPAWLSEVPVEPVGNTGTSKANGSSPKGHELTWNAALTLLSRVSQGDLYRYAYAKPPGGAYVPVGHAHPRSSLSATQSRYISDLLQEIERHVVSGSMPWEVALRLFGERHGISEAGPSRQLSGRSGGPARVVPHTTRVVRPQTSERLVLVCPTWEHAVQLACHSASTLRHPTQVPQLLTLLTLQRLREGSPWSGGKSLLSWEAALACLSALQPAHAEGLPREGRGGATVISQRCMTEIVRHCVFHATAMRVAYDHFVAQEYSVTEGVHVYLSLFRCARLCSNGDLAVRAAADFVTANRSPASGTQSAPSARSCRVSCEGARQFWSGLLAAYRRGLLPWASALEVLEMLRERGLVGEVEEVELEASTAPPTTRSSTNRLGDRS